MIQRLSRGEPALDQIRRAVEKGTPLVHDLRTERAGDKAASVGVCEWIAKEVQAPITILETEGSPITEFRLSDFHLPEGVSVATEGEGFDCHTVGTGCDSLWGLAPYCNARGIYGSITLREPVPVGDEILFFLSTENRYNERRDMSVEHARSTVDYLRGEGLSVHVLVLKDEELFPDALRLPMGAVVKRIAGASCVIGGDVGTSHISAALQTPIVAIYPDWQWVPEISGLGNAIAIAEWWGINAQEYPKQFLPNAPYSRRRIVELNDRHEWARGHVLDSVLAIKR